MDGLIDDEDDVDDNHTTTTTTTKNETTQHTRTFTFDVRDVHTTGAYDMTPKPK